MTAKNIVILGSTGSIGTQALDVIRAFPKNFKLMGITGHSNMKLLSDQANEFKPPFLVVPSETKKNELNLLYSPTIFIGDEGLLNLVTQPMHILLVAVVGTAALAPVVSAIPHVSHIAIANKEVLVAAGDIIMAMVKAHNTKLIPVDSEHSALFQCLAAVDFDSSVIRKITLTASGGPFWERNPSTFDSITPKDALKHPNWDMGAKISIDSATMMNKGLEVIEAHHLFGIDFDHIDVVVHPKSIVHAFIETIDGAIISHLGRPDMRYPIQYALTYPERFETPFPQHHLTELSGLEFFKPNREAFPLLDLAISCGRRGGVSPIIFNAANEVAVDLFLKEQISFTAIHTYILNALDRFGHLKADSIDDVIALDQEVKATSFNHSH